jgi:hypothetical protein
MRLSACLRRARLQLVDPMRQLAQFLSHAILDVPGKQWSAIFGVGRQSRDQRKRGTMFRMINDLECNMRHLEQFAPDPGCLRVS